MNPIGKLLLMLLASASVSTAAAPIKVLIVDGQNNHNWKAMTPFMKAQLEGSGRYQVDVATTPAQLPSPPKAVSAELKAKAEAAAAQLRKQFAAKWDAFRPDFARYGVVLSNYNGEDWPAPVQTAFEKYMREGGRFVCVHAADNSFPNWGEYNKMIGLGGWGGRTEKHGPYVYYDGEGKEVRDTSKGAGGSHGAQHEFVVQIRKADHPITRGMPAQWKHAQDELYDSLRGPAENMDVLATAWCEKTRRHEPMMMVIRYGKGITFHTPMGHENGQSLQCVGFLATLDRACEWLATGAVTQSLPPGFPTAGKSSKVGKQ